MKTVWRIATVALMLGSTPMAGIAQTLFEQLDPKAHLKHDGIPNRCLAIGDLDGDGFLDLVLGRQPQPISWGKGTRVVFGNGFGGFTRSIELPSCPGVCERANAIAIGDVDADGDLDLVIAVDHHPIRLWRNSGRGAFALETSPFHATPTSAPVDLDLADIEGDGDLDLVVTTGSLLREVRLLDNDGSGTFYDGGPLVPLRPGLGTARTEVLDIDGDGDEDVVALGSTVAVLVNNGLGSFSDETATRWLLGPALGCCAVVGDIDADGDLDLLLGNTSLDTCRVAVNSGSGVFAPGSPTQLPADAGVTHRSTLADIDADGDLDLFADRYRRLFRNDGTGTFVEDAASPLDTSADVGTASFVDVDGDSAPDLVLSERAELWINDGSGGFLPANRPSIPAAEIRPGEVVDADGDGDLDVFLGTRLYLNDGHANFTAGPTLGMPFAQSTPSEQAAADINGDGWADLAVSDGAITRLFVSDGMGGFADATASWLPPGFAGRDLLFVDVDSDTDVDLLAQEDGVARLLINDGAGALVDETSVRMPGNAQTFPLCAADVDSDGAIDLVSVAEVWRNIGNGVFILDTASMPAPPNSAPSWLYDAAIADLDLDGDLDLVAQAPCCDHPTVLYTNDGSGTFTNAPSRLPSTGLLGHPVAVDFDLDGDTDLVFSLHGALENTGSGQFVDAGNRFVEFPGRFYGDFDGDGDPDHVSQVRVSGGVVHNLTRHLHAPFLARTGRPYALRVFDADTSAPRLTSVFVARRLAATSIPTPFGSFALHPIGVATLPLAALPVGTPMAELRFTLPGNRSLVGQAFYAQAFIVSGTPSGIVGRLTNTVIDVVAN